MWRNFFKTWLCKMNSHNHLVMSSKFAGRTEGLRKFPAISLSGWRIPKILAPKKAINKRFSPCANSFYGCARETLPKFSKNFNQNFSLHLPSTLSNVFTQAHTRGHFNCHVTPWRQVGSQNPFLSDLLSYASSQPNLVTIPDLAAKIEFTQDFSTKLSVHLPACTQ
ncbi:hypothetical protein O6H91_10G091100 [Diphasiastrum complanatum]|uniref:Uncharacterized protein n=1 Tax=Diphasiastrum complanatum TaxID=34168 RepID=A0ACC2CJG9_DIPCM|nr:hypothetical protein O6H91_10G091100 [Diphasiastrum complanatum]